MKSLQCKSFFLLAALLISLPSFGQGLKAFKLKNGLSVYIWEDNTKSDVYGAVGVRTGSVNDPEQYTGLAHYLEHVMFKGTDKISTLDWAAEEPIYKQIIAKYDEMAEETDPAQKEAISKEINELTIEAGKVSVSSEFSNLMESMGAKGLNAGTSYDYTIYYNSFPAYQINKWLEISSQRFINPVFRTFQSELETVYEEYNRSQDNPGRMQQEFLLNKAFEGHPYSRSVIGLPEHLKNPRLSKLIEYYNTWYTPENMVLILVGNVNARQISGRINAAFGRLAPKSIPERKQYPDLDIKGRTQYNAKIGYYPSVYLVYKGVPSGHPDEKALKIAMELLANNSNTGTLNKLVIDGELTGGAAFPLTFREQGRNVVNLIPLYDENQRRFESNKSAEKKALKAIQQIANGEFEDWAVEAIKNNICRDYDLQMEFNENRANELMDAFINEADLGKVLNYKDEIMAITHDDIKRVAKQYLSDNYLALYIDKGNSKDENKIKKPGYKPIEPPVGKQSLYATQFKNMPIGHVDEKFIDFSDVQTKQLNDRSKMHYTLNPENNIFSLTLRYGVGEREFPKLGIAADLMNNAGIMGTYEPQQLKEELSKLNATCSVNADEDYLYITMRGYEETLPQACQLLARQILMPKLDDKQLSRIKGSILGSRQQRKENVSLLANALTQYIRYGEKSSYIDELTDKEVYELQISELTGDINRAANYEAEIFYCGTLPFDNAYDILSKNLPLVANERPSQSPQDRPLAPVTENTVYFLPNANAEQAQISFYLPMQAYDKKDDVLRDAFFQYFSGGFNGLVINEIREKRSMAYSAGAAIMTPEITGNPTCMIGSIGTQNDKANDAVDVFMELINNMPENAERIDNIKSYMRQEALSSHPEFRYKAQYLKRFQQMGYKGDPAEENLPKIDALTFNDIVKFYKEHIKGKPYAIGIMGNPKSIDLKRLEKYGKVVRLTERKLFNTKDTLF
ncbi:M16 family metallopeptidase [Bacteroides sp.]|uniref:M16 family metallopeptidase n=1 Tax=Bacteroides sp. TaxID=29523 RepID=UPI0023D63226|nr:M16 family metallopeptidase [Bacteroides sp.]MDE6215705.1 insulinase family protein [Bacteroides sp.]